MVKPDPKDSTSFASMGDDFIDARFDPQYKQMFRDQLDSFDKAVTKKIYPIEVRFFGGFDEKTQKAIGILVNETFHNAKKFNLHLKKNVPEVHFFTPDIWVEKNPKYKGQNLVLPASKITWQLGLPLVNLIVPQKVTGTETVIKTVRLLCSKLFGKLFFEEYIYCKPQFRRVMETMEKATFDLDEIVPFCRFFGEFSPALLKRFDQTAANLMVRGPKAREIGQKEFFQQMILKGEKSPVENLSLIKEQFEKIKLQVKEDPKAFYQKLSSKIFEQFSQVTVILPHELQNFRFLQTKGDWTFFHALEERLQIIVHYLQDVDECRNFMTPVNSENRLDYNLADLWVATLNERSKRLKKQGFVKIFMIPDAKLTPKQISQKNSFPLWIWKNRILQNYPETKNSSKLVEKIQNQYVNNVYQKLFEVSQRLILGLKAMQNDYTLEFDKMAEYARLKSLLSWLDFRRDHFLDLFHASRLGKRLLGLAEDKLEDQRRSVEEFETGWSYFVSFALIHQYYLNIAKKKDPTNRKDRQFYELIDNYTKQRIEKQSSFRIANLLLDVYHRKNYRLELLTELIVEDSKSLDFFVFNQDRIFKTEKETTSKIIENYAEGLIHWIEENHRFRIREEELKNFSPAPLEI